MCVCDSVQESVYVTYINKQQSLAYTQYIIQWTITTSTNHAHRNRNRKCAQTNNIMGILICILNNIAKAQVWYVKEDTTLHTKILL